MIASLPMYDLAEIRRHTDALWTSIARRLVDAGVDDVPTVLTRPEGELVDHWLDPSLLLSQTCGYPLVRALSDAQHVLGSFVVRAGDPDRPGWYRSVIVARTSDPRAAVGIEAFDGARLAANDDGSLSGWVSLGVALHDADVRPGTIALTGAHVGSCERVSDGRADLASIDAHTFALLQAHRPAAVERLRIIGRGPQVAVTPLITAQERHVDVLRRSVAAAVESLPPDAADALQLEGFVVGGREMHEQVRSLAMTALAALRPGEPGGAMS